MENDGLIILSNGLHNLALYHSSVGIYGSCFGILSLCNAPANRRQARPVCTSKRPMERAGGELARSRKSGGEARVRRGRPDVRDCELLRAG